MRRSIEVILSLVCPVLPLLPATALAQADPFADLGASKPDVVSTACNLVVAHEAAFSFHVFTAAVVVVAALASVGVWYFLDRMTLGGPFLRMLLSSLFAGLVAFGALVWNPLANDAVKVMMATADCQVEFALGSMYPYGQAFVLALLPAMILGFIASFIANRLV